MQNNDSNDLTTRRRALQVIGVGVFTSTSALIACTQEGGGKEGGHSDKKGGHSTGSAKKEGAASKPKEDKKKDDGAMAEGGEKTAMKEGGDGKVECDTSGIDAQSKQMRKTLQYVEKSEKEGKVCSNCMQWVEPKKGEACGGCKLFSGPVNPNGYCLSYAPMKKA